MCWRNLRIILNHFVDGRNPAPVINWLAVCRLCSINSIVERFLVESLSVGEMLFCSEIGHTWPYPMILFNSQSCPIFYGGICQMGFHKKKSTAELGCARATAGGEKGRHGQLFLAEGSLIDSVMGCRWLCVCVCHVFWNGADVCVVCIVCVIIPNALLGLRPSMDKWWQAFSRGQAPWWGWLYSPVNEHRWFHDILWIIGLELQAFIRSQGMFWFCSCGQLCQFWCSQSVSPSVSQSASNWGMLLRIVLDRTRWLESF